MEKPDKWMLVRITGNDPHWRIFATWHGGYTYGDSWRFNSGIKSVKEEDDYYDFVGYSGSVYRCRKTGYGVTMYGVSVLKDLIDKSGNKIEALWEEPANIPKTMNGE